MSASFGYFRQTMQYITSLETSCSSQGYISFQCPLNSLFLFFSELFSVVLSVFSSMGRVVSGLLLDSGPLRGWLLLGVAVKGLLFTKTVRHNFQTWVLLNFFPVVLGQAFLALSHGKNHQCSFWAFSSLHLCEFSCYLMMMMMMMM